MPDESLPGETAHSARESIKDVVALEEQQLRERSRGQRLSDALVAFMGRLGFVLAHVALLAAWFAINVGLVPGVPPFDPFPFGILTLIVSTEGVLLALFILISQNRMARQADLRAHLNLQISLLAEKESTRVLQIVEALAQQFGVSAADEEVQRLVEPTDVPRLARELREKLPDE